MLNEELNILFAFTVKYIENGISMSVVVWFLVYFVEKEAVKAKMSSNVSTWAKKALSDVLSARCVYIHYWSLSFLLVAYTSYSIAGDFHPTNILLIKF